MTPSPTTPVVLVLAAALPASGAPATDGGTTAPAGEAIVEPNSLDTTLRFKRADPPRTAGGAHDAPSDHPGDEGVVPTVIEFETGFRPAPPRSVDIGTLWAPVAAAPYLNDAPDAIEDPLQISFGRNTTMVDGGFGIAPSTDETGASFFESPGERFDRYSLDLEWVPAGAENQVQWLVLGGIQAVRADIRRLDDARLTITQARGMVAIPTIGTGVRWQPTDYLEFSTTASTQSIDGDAGVVDVTLSAQLQLSRLVDLTAGYEYYQSQIAVENLRTSLDREGVFAKLTIRF